MEANGQPFTNVPLSYANRLVTGDYGPRLEDDPGLPLFEGPIELRNDFATGDAVLWEWGHSNEEGTVISSDHFWCTAAMEEFSDEFESDLTNIVDEWDASLKPASHCRHFMWNVFRGGLYIIPMTWANRLLREREASG